MATPIDQVVQDTFLALWKEGLKDVGGPNDQLESKEKRGVIVALRKLRRRQVRELLNQKRAGKTGT